MRRSTSATPLVAALWVRQAASAPRVSVRGGGRSPIVIKAPQAARQEMASTPHAKQKAHAKRTWTKHS